MGKGEWLEDVGLNSNYVGAEIMREHCRQIEKWGYQTHNVFEWLAFTTEELGELSKAISEYVYRDGNKEDIVKEAIQVATLAIKIARMADEQL